MVVRPVLVGVLIDALEHGDQVGVAHVRLREIALDVATPVQRALCGANASLFRADALRVNGFDESIKYGGGDKEFGVRLQNAGVRGQHLRYTAPLVHLDHPRGYRDEAQIRRHKVLIREVRRSGRSWTPTGIEKAVA